MMKNRHSKLYMVGVVIMVLAGFSVWFTAVQAAGSASLSLSPASGSYTKGSNFTITIRENSTDQINAVQADLTYDQSKLQFVSINTGISTFNYAFPSSGGNGSVSIARGVANGGTISGNQTVASVTFKVLAGSGSSAISFAGSSAIVRPSDGQNVWNGNTAGGTYSFTTPASPPPSSPPPSPPSPSPSPTPSPSPSPSPSPNPNPSPSPTPNPDSPSPSSTPDREPNNDNQRTNPDRPVPVNKDIATNSGFLVAIQVVNSAGELVSDASVSLGDQSVTSDASGIASFAGIAPGEHEVSVETAAGNAQVTVAVAGDRPSSEVQQFEVELTSEKISPVQKAAIGVGVGLPLAGGAAWAWHQGMFQSLVNKRKYGAGSALSSSVSPSQTFMPDKPTSVPEAKPSGSAPGPSSPPTIHRSFPTDPFDPKA